MTEPTKDTAIDIAPKTQPTQGRVPKIVAEINRVASRVRDRNKKKEDHDAEVLENDGLTESISLSSGIFTRIVRENTHRRRGVDKVIMGLLVFISVQIMILCVFLGRIDDGIRTGNKAVEHKAVFWSDSVFDFKTAAENEGVSTADMEACITPTSNTSFWQLHDLPILNQKCLVELLMSTLAKDNWTLATAHAWEQGYRNAYHFTRPV